MSEIAISYGLPRAGLPAAQTLRRSAEAALQACGRPSALSIRLVDETEGRTLNRDYRHKDYATNVLSFPVELPEGVPVDWLGDLVLCAPVVAREASEQGKTLRAHYAHLVVHGVLHLLGFDHENKRDAERMEAEERRILAQLGIADPYAGETR